MNFLFDAFIHLLSASKTWKEKNPRMARVQLRQVTSTSQGCHTDNKQTNCETYRSLVCLWSKGTWWNVSEICLFWNLNSSRLQWQAPCCIFLLLFFFCGFHNHSHFALSLQLNLSYLSYLHQYSIRRHLANHTGCVAARCRTPVVVIKELTPDCAI